MIALNILCLTHLRYENEETGDIGEYPVVSVVGKGNINFKTIQTGF